MKRVVLIAVVLLATGGLAFGAIELFGAGDVAPVESDARAPVFVTLEPFVVPVIREGRVVKQVSLTITLGSRRPPRRDRSGGEDALPSRCIPDAASRPHGAA
jgi:hypothetical protein